MKDKPIKILSEMGKELAKPIYGTPDINRAMAQQMQQFDDINKRLVRVQHEERMKEERYKQETLSTLKNIEKNTGDISQLVSLLNANTEKQSEILEVMTEIMSIGISGTEDEAESKYRKVMNKITQTFDDAETMEKLLGYSKVFYHSAIEYIKHKIENG